MILSKKTVVIFLLSTSVNASSNVDQFCENLSGSQDYCEVAQAAKIASETCRSCNDDLSTISNIFNFEIPRETLVQYCQLASAGNDSNGESGESSNDEFCANPKKVVCGEDSDGKFALDPQSILSKIRSPQKKNSWLSLFYARENNAIVLGKPLGKMNPRSNEYKDQVFVGTENKSNLITTFAAESLKEFSSDGDTSSGKREIKDLFKSEYSNYIAELSETSMASNTGFRKRSARLESGLVDTLSTPDEYLSDILPQPLPQSWKTSEGKSYFMKQYAQYNYNCGTDGLKPKVFFSRYVDSSGALQEKLVMCPGFILAKKNKPNDHQLDGEVIKALSDFMTLPITSNLDQQRSNSGEAESYSEEEKQFINCFTTAGSKSSCYPEPSGESKCLNHASANLGDNTNLSNELLDKVIASKGLKGDALKDWVKNNYKGSCGQPQFAPAFSAGLRKSLACETGIEFSNSCLANGAVNGEASSGASSLSCAHVCLNGGCQEGRVPNMVQRDTIDGHFGGASGINGVAPIALGTSHRGGKMCAYSKNGQRSFQSPLPLGFTCGGRKVAGYCDDQDASHCMKTWQSANMWRGVSCIDTNGSKSLPQKVNKEEILTMQQVQLDQKCEDAKARYSSISQRRIQYHNGVYSPERTIGSEVEAARDSVNR